MKEEVTDLYQQLEEKKEDIKELNRKLEEMDTALYSKIRLTESKLDHRIEELVESNKKITESVKKVDKFAILLDEVKEDTEKLRLRLMKKFEEADQIHKNRLESEILNLNKGIL